MPHRLASILLANARMRSGDLLFAVFIALAALVAVSALGIAADAARTHIASR